MAVFVYSANSYLQGGVFFFKVANYVYVYICIKNNANGVIINDDHVYYSDTFLKIIAHEIDSTALCARSISKICYITK